MRAARGEAVADAQLRWQTPGGPKVITIHAARIPAMFGHSETVLIAFDDITALKDVQAQLEEAVRVRQDFLSIAGHELKTPLTSVMLNLRAVDNSLQGARAGDARLAARWQALGRQIGRLDGLVDQLLDVSRITAGKMVLAPEPIELGELVREVVGHFSPTFAPDTGTIDVRADAPVEGLWDRLRLEQILTNLLSNAVKYGAGRPISVEVGAAGRATTRKPGSPSAIAASACPGASWVGSSGASNAPSPSATTAASGWASGSCARWSTPWAATLPSRANPTAGRRSRCGCHVARRSPASTQALAPRARRAGLRDGAATTRAAW